jgi:hypothetical protein
MNAHDEYDDDDDDEDDDEDDDGKLMTTNGARHDLIVMFHVIF